MSLIPVVYKRKRNEHNRYKYWGALLHKERKYSCYVQRGVKGNINVMPILEELQYEMQTSLK